MVKGEGRESGFFPKTTNNQEIHYRISIFDDTVKVWYARQKKKTRSQIMQSKWPKY